jgi:hypothetical protein
MDLDDYVLSKILNSCDYITRTKIRVVCHRWNRTIGEITWVSSKGKRRHLNEFYLMKPHDVLFESAYLGSVQLIQWIAPEITFWDVALHGACLGGHREIAEMMVENGAKVMNYGLCGACRGGHSTIVQWLIDKGANNWNWGLYHACQGGHRGIAQWMIDKGANDWIQGLCGACQCGHQAIVRWMIEKGATVCNCEKTLEEHLGEPTVPP